MAGAFQRFWESFRRRGFLLTAVAFNMGYLLLGLSLLSVYFALPDARQLAEQSSTGRSGVCLAGAAACQRETEKAPPFARTIQHSRRLLNAHLLALGCRFEFYEPNPTAVYQAVFLGRAEGCHRLSRVLATRWFLRARHVLPNPVEEALLAIRIENELSREQILHHYLSYLPRETTNPRKTRAY